MVRRALLLVAALAVAACGQGGDGDGSPDDAAVAADARAVVAGHLPDGYVMVRAADDQGGRVVDYAPAADGEWRLRIVAAPPAAATEPGGRDERQVEVRGHEATLVALTDEGREYGVGLAWDERPDLRIQVLGANGPSVEEVVAVAEDVRSVPEDEWQRLLTAFSPDTHVGRPDPAATPVEAMRGSVDGDEYVLTALVPGGYPVGPDDQRLSCFRLTYRGETTPDHCPGHPIWARIEGRLLLFGDVGADVPAVRIRDRSGAGFAPFTVDTTPAPTGPPIAFYVAPLPEGACSVSVDAVGGSSPGPGETGPLADQEDDRARCLALATAPPTTVPDGATPTSVAGG